MRWALIGICLACWGCAAGSSTSPTDAGSAGEGGGITFPDGIPRTEAGAPLVDLFSSAEAPPPLDQDQDGHCVPGAKDPGGVCKSFGDCDDSDPKRHPGALELCADVGVDNDCDFNSAEVDEDEDGKDDLGQPCSTGLPGICDAGSMGCQGAVLTCQGTVKPGTVAETCDGTDEDCDGTPDNGGGLCQHGNTCEGKAGCRCAGGPPCASGDHCCGGCVDLATSTDHCGGCNIACGAKETCAQQRCRCGSVLGAIAGGPACSTSCDGTTCTVPCNPSLNIAPQAAPSSSGGGSGSYGPAAMVDGKLQSSCDFCWIKASSSSSSGKWIRLDWPKAVTVGRVWFDTAPVGGACSGSGRTLAGGKLQVWTGSSWSTVEVVSGQTNDWERSFTPVQTTRLRLYDAHATNVSGQKSNPIIFEWRVFCK